MNPKYLWICILTLCLFTFGCESGKDSSKDESVENISDLLNQIKVQIPTTSSYLTTSSEEDIHLKDSVSSVNNTVKDISKSVNKSEKTEDPEEKQGILNKIKTKLIDYMESDEGKDNQFTSEFHKIFFETNFESISNEKVRDILERISTGFDKAEIILSKGLNLGRTIGSILLPVIQIYTQNPSPEIQQIFKEEGPIHRVAKILQKARVGRHILSTAANLTNKAITKIKEFKSAKIDKRIEMVRQLFISAKDEMLKHKKLLAFVKSSIPKKQETINKIATTIHQNEATIKTEEKQPKKGVSQSSNLLESDDTTSKQKQTPKLIFVPCTGSTQFQYFCSNKK